MPKPPDNRSHTPYDHVLTMMANSLELAVGQQLDKARDVLRGARKMADGLGFKEDHIFTQLDDAIVTKPFAALKVEFKKGIDEVRKSSKAEK